MLDTSRRRCDWSHGSERTWRRVDWSNWSYGTDRSNWAGWSHWSDWSDRSRNYRAEWAYRRDWPIRDRTNRTDRSHRTNRADWTDWSYRSYRYFGYEWCDGTDWAYRSNRTGWRFNRRHWSDWSYGCDRADWSDGSSRNHRPHGADRSDRPDWAGTKRNARSGRRYGSSVDMDAYHDCRFGGEWSGYRRGKYDLHRRNNKLQYSFDQRYVCLSQFRVDYKRRCNHRWERCEFYSGGILPSFG